MKEVRKSVLLLGLSIVVGLNLEATVEMGLKCMMILSPFFIGLIIMLMLNPAVDWLTKRRIKRGTSIVLVLIGVLGFMSLIICVIIPVLLQSLTNVETSIPKLWLKLQKVPHLALIQTEIQNKVSKIEGVTGLSLGLLEYTQGLLQKGVEWGMGIVLAIYMLIYKPMYEIKLAKSVSKVQKRYGKRRAQYIQEVLEILETEFSVYMGAKMLDSAIIGVITGVGCAVFHIENGVLIGTIIGLTNVLPYFGPFIGAIPAGIVATLQGGWSLLILLVMLLVIQQFDGNVLGPKLVGSRLGLDGLEVVGGLILLTGLLGVPGMVIGLPLLGAIKKIVKLRIGEVEEAEEKV